MAKYKLDERLICPHCGEVESEDYFVNDYVCVGLKCTFVDFCVCSKCGESFDILMHENTDIAYVGKLVIADI